MIYCGSSYTEKIEIREEESRENAKYFIIINREKDTFTVSCSREHYREYINLIYTFYMRDQSDYERVKFNIMESIFESKDVYDLIRRLKKVFDDGFSDIIKNDN